MVIYHFQHHGALCATKTHLITNEKYGSHGKIARLISLKRLPPESFNEVGEKLYYDPIEIYFC